MATVNVRYMVDDVNAAVAFYTTLFRSSRRTVARRSSKPGLAPSPTDLNTTACTPSKRRSGRDFWITKSEPAV